MSGTILSSADLDPRRRRLLFRSWHRGMRETDLLIGQFADQYLVSFSDLELDLFESLIEHPDRDILNWITEVSPLPEEIDRMFFDRLKTFHTHLKPINV